jgi:hypothetical protein
MSTNLQQKAASKAHSYDAERTPSIGLISTNSPWPRAEPATRATAHSINEQPFS